jgi:hypothetical protein
MEESSDEDSETLTRVTANSSSSSSSGSASSSGSGSSDSASSDSGESDDGNSSSSSSNSSSGSSLVRCGQGFTKRCVLCLGLPIAPSYMSPNAGGEGGGVAGSQPMSTGTAVHRSPNKIEIWVW